MDPHIEQPLNKIKELLPDHISYDADALYQLLEDLKQEGWKEGVNFMEKKLKEVIEKWASEPQGN